MKKILLLSDSHGNHYLLSQVLEQVPDADYVFHLGDNYEDLDTHFDLLHKKIVLRVPGLYHPYYAYPKIPSVQTISIHDWTFALAHSLNDFTKHTAKADLYCYGHTHHPDLHQKNSNWFLNPGHLKQPEDRGNKASFSTLNVSPAQIEIKLFTIDGNLFLEKTLLKQKSYINAEVK